MTRAFAFPFAYLIVLLSSSAAVAADGSEQRLQRFLGEVQTLSARFEQVQLDEHGGQQARRSGDFMLARPGRFRWTYSAPYQQLMVCDGTQIWNYEPDLAQVTVRDAADILRDTPAALLAQGESLQERFAVADGGSEGKLQILRLEPRTADADFRMIELWLDKSGMPSRMRFHDPLGGTSDIRFSDVKRNPRIDPLNFRFTPPKGVEIVELDPRTEGADESLLDEPPQ